jgi:hypothetical protein
MPCIIVEACFSALGVTIIVREINKKTRLLKTRMYDTVKIL